MTVVTYDTWAAGGPRADVVADSSAGIVSWSGSRSSAIPILLTSALPREPGDTNRPWMPFKSSWPPAWPPRSTSESPRSSLARRRPGSTPLWPMLFCRSINWSTPRRRSSVATKPASISCGAGSAAKTTHSSASPTMRAAASIVASCLVRWGTGNQRRRLFRWPFWKLASPEVALAVLEAIRQGAA